MAKAWKVEEQQEKNRKEYLVWKAWVKRVFETHSKECTPCVATIIINPMEYKIRTPWYPGKIHNTDAKRAKSEALHGIK